MGNDKPRSGAGNMMKTDFLERFEAAGFARSTIDTVLCTHLHIDHVGWNTMFHEGRWIPTFPNARYLIARGEFNYWREKNEGDDAAIFGDSVQPVFDAGLMDLVDYDHRICEEVSLIPTPGHTPGHVSVSIISRGEKALITGDAIHSPAQMARPDWAAFVDYDQDASTQTRRGFLADVADTPVLVIGTHFVAPTAGVVVRDGDAYRFEA
jgi:glyoxylase-like metal-dependent hydrolase (beta-lactamase superfamily II)